SSRPNAVRAPPVITASGIAPPLARPAPIVARRDVCHDTQCCRIAAAPGGSSWIQLLEPRAPDTPVGRFLARRGEGVHHIGYPVAGNTAAAPGTGRRGGGPPGPRAP